MDQTNVFISAIVGVAILLAHTGALFYWGGRITKAIDHLEKILGVQEQRIIFLERKK